jgi:flavin-binding protein dodecin
VPQSLRAHELPDQRRDGTTVGVRPTTGRVTQRRKHRRLSMSVAKVTEISATSAKSFEDAIQQGLTRSAKTLRNVRGAWIKEQHVRCTDGRITEYQVNMMVTFVLDD